MIDPDTIFDKRRKLRLSQTELGDEVGVSRTTIQRMEGKKIGKASYENVSAVAKFLGISMDDEGDKE